MAGLDAELEAALMATEASFHVWLIATVAPDLIWAPPNVKATRWLADNHPDFDQFPVKDDDGTVGVLLRDPMSRTRRLTSVRRMTFASLLNGLKVFVTGSAAFRRC